MKVFSASILALLIATPATAQYTQGQAGAGYTSAQDTTPAVGIQRADKDPAPPVKKKKTGKKSDSGATKASKKKTDS